MAKPAEYHANTLTDYTGLIETILKQCCAASTRPPHEIRNWYRGCGMAQKFRLQPSLFRHPTKKTIDELLQLESRLLDWWTRRSPLFQSIATDRMYDNLFFMQHYGVPTRLLDWTENPFIALYFALTSAAHKENSKTYKEDASVWVLDPLGWNEKSLGRKMGGDEGILGPADPDASGYGPKVTNTQNAGMRDDPICMYGISNSQRIIAQKGVFTIFGREINPMEQTFDKNQYPSHALSKILIPKGSIDSLLQSLLATGVTDSAVFPDLQGLTMEIKRAFGFIL